MTMSEMYPSPAWNSDLNDPKKSKEACDRHEQFLADRDAAAADDTADDDDDDIITCEDRAEYARPLFDVSPYDEEGCCDVSLIDILTNLMHLADVEGWDFDKAVEIATWHHGEEVDSMPMGK
jgi:hypothetical protein